MKLVYFKKLWWSSSFTSVSRAEDRGFQIWTRTYANFERHFRIHTSLCFAVLNIFPRDFLHFKAPGKLQTVISQMKFGKVRGQAGV